MSHLIRKLIDTAAPVGLPIAAVAAFLLLPTPWPGFVLAAAALGFGWYQHGADGLGTNRVGRVLVVSALLLQATRAGIDVPAAIAGTLLIGMIGFEPKLLVAVSTRRLATANLPVHRAPIERWINARNAYLLVSVLTAGLLATFATGITAWVIAAAAAVVTAGFAAGIVVAWRWRRNSAHSGDTEVVAAVKAHAPKFAVHFAAPAGSEYQVLMWLPYFDKLGDPYVVILRDQAFLPAVSAATTAPIVVAPSIGEVESLLVPGLRAVFYANNSMQNTQCVRFAELTHIQLMHGDSDKPPSYNPISAMYDRIFVAGQAGVDRYHNHGIDIPESRFRIVGHPQVTRVEVSDSPRDRGKDPVALYAPTWTGLSSDVNFCSLPLARDICKALLDRGATVIVRPHPYTRRNPAAARQLDAVEKLLADDAAATGRKHLFGKTTSAQMSLTDCINAADVMVTDASGAASDWLYSEKPFAVTDVTGLGDRLADELPLARAAYTVAGDGSNLAAVCDELLDTDSLATARQKMKAYYLGEFPAEEYEAAFLTAARDCYR